MGPGEPALDDLVAIRSSLAVASRAPSGLNATPRTSLVWPVSGLPWGWPVVTFHSRTVRSALAGAGLGVGCRGLGRRRRPTAAPSDRRWWWPAAARRG